MSDEEEQLVKNVLNLNKKVTFSKPLRTEPTSQISEFNLVKSGKRKNNTIRVGDLTDALKQKVKHVNVRQKIQTFEKKVKPLPKPLAKVKSDRIRRSTAFDKVKKHLNRWNAVVTSNRGSNHLTFPLQDDIKLESGKLSTSFRLKSDLQKRLEAFDETTEVFELEKKSPYPLTMREMLERRKEMMKIKIIENQKAAKARRQNKIKSKKYHRIQRREKIKNQIKEFEQLQQSNPEEALKKLDEIERVRAEERASLRHRNTGKWAKSKQVKAKYDNTNREELAQQLAISRELTQKINLDDDQSDYEEEEVNEVQVSKDDNPWVNPIKTSEEVETFLKGYRKFWDERNTSNETKTHEESQEVLEVNTNGDCVVETDELPNNFYDSQKQSEVCARETAVKLSKVNANIRCMATSAWEVGVLSDTDDEQEEIDILFDKYNDKFQEKLTKFKNSLKENNRKNERKEKSKKIKKQKLHSDDLSFKMEAKRPIIDEPLTEISGDNHETETALSTVLKYAPPLPIQTTKNIDPNDIICTKPVDLETQLPDLLGADDNEEDDDQRGAIVEAFRDDDIVESFQKEKRDEIEGDKPKDIDLSLPGWGAWGGPGISVKKKRRNRRFILKFPKQVKRRDDNKGNLIINEKSNEKIKNHLVSEVPFPFKSVKDFEASIRAPVGNTFVPETAFRRMIKPAVVTKMGTVIKPMSEEILLRTKS